MSDVTRPFRPAGILRSSVYGLLWHASTLLHRAGSAFEYLAGGVLRRRDLRTAMGIQFQNFGASAEAVDNGLDAFERRLYNQWLPPGGRVLLVGCGAGRDLIGLARLGYQTTGVEPQPEQVERARQHLARCGVSASIACGPIETIDLDAHYDAVIFASACYSNMQSSRIRAGTLSRLRSHMTPGGRLIIRYIPSASRSRAATALLRLSARLSAADWRPEPGDTFARYYESNGNLYFQHSFLPGEAARECTAAGFTVLDDSASTGGDRIIVLEVA